MLRATKATLLFMLTCSVAWGQQSGVELLSDCGAAVAFMDKREPLTDPAARCIHYITGFTDAVNTLYRLNLHRQSVCIPPTVTFAQTVRVVEKALREHPDKLHEPVGILTLLSLNKAFPCRPK